jgi:hypothetical protein
MKKLLPILLLLTSFSLFVGAQNFQIYNLAGEDISNMTIDLYGSVDDQELLEEMKVQNISAVNHQVKFKKNHISLVPNTENFICVGQSCYPNSIMVSTPFIVFAGMLQTDIASCHYRPNGNVGSSTIMYTFMNDDQVSYPGDSVSITVNYTITSSIDEADATSFLVYPNPATNLVKFSYQVNTTKDSWFTIYNLLGNVVKTVRLEKTSGSLDIPVSDLEAGIYFYTVSVNGKSIETSKLVIK